MEKNKESFGGTEIKPSNLYGKIYNTSENQLTKALLHLIDAGGLELVAYLCEKLGILNPRDLLTIKSQISYTNAKEKRLKGDSVPDGFISVNPIRLVIESKIVKNSINLTQLNRHIEFVENLTKSPDSGDAVLLYITPDEQVPEPLKEAEVIWINWNNLSEILSGYCNSVPPLRYLFESFVKHKDMIIYKKIEIPDERKVAIVAAKIAEEEAVNYSRYRCQGNRDFKNAHYFAFYKDKMIKYVFKIVSGPEALPNGEDKYTLELALDRSNDPIINDKKDFKNHPTPFTMGVTRYADFEDLKIAKKTSEIEYNKKPN